MIVHEYPTYVCMDFSTNLSPILCLDPMQPPPPPYVQETPLPCFMLKFAQFPTRTSTVTSTYNIVVTQEYDRDDTDQDQDAHTVEIWREEEEGETLHNYEIQVYVNFGHPFLNL